MNIHLKTALKNARRFPFQSLIAGLTLTLTFFLTTVFAFLFWGMGNVVGYFESRPQIIAFLKLDAKEELSQSLYERLSTDQRVKELKYVNRQEALNLYREMTKDNPQLSQQVSPTIFPESIEFSLYKLDDASGLIKELENESIIEQVGFTASLGSESELETALNRLRNTTFYIRLIGLGLMVIFGGTSLVVLVSIISLRLVGRKDELQLLRLVGATKGFLRAPVIWEALVYSLPSAFIGYLMGVSILLFTASSVVSFFGGYPIFPTQILSLLWLLLGVGGGVIGGSLLLSILSGYYAVARSQKLK